MDAPAGIRAGIVTASDRSARGERPDASGPALRAALAAAGIAVSAEMVLPDDRDALAEALRRLADSGLDVVLVTGGTGLGPRDVTPEAIRDVIDREVPGIGEAVRAEGRRRTPFAALSRAVAGVRGRTLIVGLPGSPRGAREGLEVILPILGHAVHMLHGGDHPAAPLAPPAAGPAPSGGGPQPAPAPAAAGVPAVAVVAPSGTGKTTLIERLLPALRRRGYRVATLKHDAHGFDMDRPGKDTWRHAQAGAAAVAISAPGRFALITAVAGDLPPERAVALLAAAAAPDLVLVEGYKAGPFPKIEVFRAGVSDRLLCSGDPLLLAVVSDTPLDVPVPRFALDDAEALADFLAGWMMAHNSSAGTAGKR